MYKDKYLKYKAKYLYLKNINIQTGGNKFLQELIEKEKIEEINELGSGWNGVIYKIKKDNKNKIKKLVFY